MNPIRRENAPALETLEDRLLLSGTVQVSVTGGNLLIVGDISDNQITIEQTGPGAYTITGQSGTTIRSGAQSGASVDVAGAVKDITLNLSAGGDNVVAIASNLVIGDVDPTTMRGRRGSLIVLGGSGDDTLALSGTAASGAITFTDNPLDGDTIQITDALGQSVTFEFDNDDIVGDASLVVRLGVDAAGTMQNFLDHFREDSGLAMQIADTSDAGTVSCSLRGTPGSAGNTYITVSSLNILADGMAGGTDFGVEAQNVSATLGGGNNLLSIGSMNEIPSDTVSTLHGGLTVTAAVGSAEVVVSQAFITGNAAVTLGAGGGVNHVIFAGSAGSDVINGSLTVAGSTADDYVQVQNGDIGGTVTINLGGGDNRFVAYSCTIDGNVTYTGGAGFFGEWIDLDQSDIMGKVTVTTGAGDDQVNLDDSQIAGAVTLTLGAGDNGAEIRGITLVGAIVVTATTGDDDVELGGAYFFGSVLLNLGAGDNTVNAADPDLTSDAIFVSSTFTVTTLGGDDQVLLSPSTGTGSIGGGLTLALGSGDNTADLENLRVTGAVALTALGGDDTITVTNDLFCRAASLNLGAGTNTANLGTVYVTGAVVLTTLDGDDTVTLDNMMFYGAVTVNLGAGTNSADLSNTVVAGKVAVTALAGDDTVTISNAHLFGAVTLTLGAGVNSADLSNTVAAGNVIVTALTGDDTVTISNAQLFGAVTLTLGAGNNTADLSNTVVAGNAAVTTLAGDDTANLSGAGLGGAVTLNLGDGVNAVDLSGAFVTGNTAVTTLAGDDTVTLDGSSLGGNAVLNLGAGQNQTTYLSGGEVGGNFIYTGLAGQDDLTLGQDGSQLTLFGTVTITTGDGGDTVSFAAASIRKALAVNAGTASPLNGSDSVSVYASDVWGNAALTTGAGADVLDLLNVDFRRSAALSTGDGADTVNVDGCRFGLQSGAFSLLAGNGADTVNVATRTDIQIESETTFLKAVTFDLGAGDDTLLIGKSTLAGGTGGVYTDAVFASATSSPVFNGGAGTNTIHYLLEGGTPGLDIFNTFRLDPIVLAFGPNPT